MMALTTRRAFITGAIALITAPAIVRVESLMPIKALNIDLPTATWRKIHDGRILNDLMDKIVNPPLVVNPDGTIDIVASKAMQDQAFATFKFLKEQIDGQ